MCTVLLALKRHAVREKKFPIFGIALDKFVYPGVSFPVGRTDPQVRTIAYLRDNVFDIPVARGLYVAY